MLYSSTPCIRLPSPARHIEELYSPFDLLESDMLNPLHELRASVIIGNNHHPRLQVLKLEELQQRVLDIRDGRAVQVST